MGNISDALGGSYFELRDFRFNHSFIPTFSSLGIKNPDRSWSENLQRNLVCTGETPFDSYYGSSENTQHTSFTEESVKWLMKELDGQPQAPWFPIEASQLTGSAYVCNDVVNTYSFPDICKLPGNVTWSLNNNNAQIISSTGTSATIKGITSGFVTLTATFQNGQTITKDLTVYTHSSIPTPAGSFKVDFIDCYNDGPLPITFVPDEPFYGIISITPSLLPHPLRSQTKDITVKYTNPCTGVYTSKVITYNYQAPECTGNNVNNSDSFIQFTQIHQAIW